MVLAFYMYTAKQNVNLYDKYFSMFPKYAQISVIVRKDSVQLATIKSA